ncbi:Hypothetical protein MVR_LOCUS192 [uncultured virus]|nr:Hypothetical protein MVR_LOCUS192 [uncultured virus]
MNAWSNQSTQQVTPNLAVSLATALKNNDYSKLTSNDLNFPIDEHGNTILHKLASSLNRNGFETLKRVNPEALAKTNINVLNKKGDTPLHSALNTIKNCEIEDYSFIDYMITDIKKGGLGADKTIPNASGYAIIERERNMPGAAANIRAYNFNASHASYASRDTNTNAAKQEHIKGLNEKVESNFDFLKYGEELLSKAAPATQEFLQKYLGVQAGGLVPDDDYDPMYDSFRASADGKERIMHDLARTDMFGGACGLGITHGEYPYTNKQYDGNKYGGNPNGTHYTHVANTDSGKSWSNQWKTGGKDIDISWLTGSQKGQGYSHTGESWKENERVKQQAELNKNAKTFEDMQGGNYDTYYKQRGGNYDYNTHANYDHAAHNTHADYEKQKQNMYDLHGGRKYDYNEDMYDDIKDALRQDGDDDDFDYRLTTDNNRVSGDSRDDEFVDEHEGSFSDSDTEDIDLGAGRNFRGNLNTGIYDSDSDGPTYDENLMVRNASGNLRSRTRNSFEDERLHNDWDNNDRDNNDWDSDQMGRQPTEADETYRSFVTKIMDLLGVDLETAREYRSALKLDIEMKNPELKGRIHDALKVKEMEKLFKNKTKLKETLDSIDMDEIKKIMRERKEEYEKRRDERDRDRKTTGTGMDSSKPKRAPRKPKEDTGMPAMTNTRGKRAAPKSKSNSNSNSNSNSRTNSRANTNKGRYTQKRVATNGYMLSPDITFSSDY